MFQPIKGHEKEDKIQSFGQLIRDEADDILRDHKAGKGTTMDQLPGNSKKPSYIMTLCLLVDDYRIDETSFGSAISVAAKEGRHEDIHFYDGNTLSQHNVNWMKHSNFIF